MVDRDILAKDSLTQALNGLCGEVEGMKANQNKVSAAMVRVAQGLQEHELRASERHVQQMEQGQEIVNALKAWNGQR